MLTVSRLRQLLADLPPDLEVTINSDAVSHVIHFIGSSRPGFIDVVGSPEEFLCGDVLARAKHAILWADGKKKEG